MQAPRTFLLPPEHSAEEHAQPVDRNGARLKITAQPAHNACQLTEQQVADQMRKLAIQGSRAPLAVAVRRCEYHWFQSTKLEAEVRVMWHVQSIRVCLL